MSTKLLTDSELQQLLPTISMGKDKPKEQQWFTRTEVLAILRDTETKVLQNNTQIWTPPLPIG